MFYLDYLYSPNIKTFCSKNTLLAPLYCNAIEGWQIPTNPLQTGTSPSVDPGPAAERYPVLRSPPGRGWNRLACTQPLNLNSWFIPTGLWQSKASFVRRVHGILQAWFPTGTLGAIVRSCLHPAFPVFRSSLTGPFQGLACAVLQSPMPHQVVPIRQHLGACHRHKFWGQPHADTIRNSGGKVQSFNKHPPPIPVIPNAR